jgi:single-strand DNA-binding protein
MYAQTTILGRVVRKELKLLPTGKQVLNFSVAVNKKYKEKETTVFFDCVAWEKTAEIVDRFFDKGNMIFLNTEPEDASYEKDGNKVYKTNYRVNTFAFTGEKKDSSNQNNSTQEPAKGLDPDSIPF